jgi:hypothetical protein
MCKRAAARHGTAAQRDQEEEAMITSVKVVEIRGRSAVAIGQAAWGGTSEGGLGVASPSISGGASSAIASTCM